MTFCVCNSLLLNKMIEYWLSIVKNIKSIFLLLFISLKLFHFSVKVSDESGDEDSNNQAQKIRLVIFFNCVC